MTDGSLGMPTSAGAAFFAGLKAKKNATVVQRVCLHLRGRDIH